MFLKTLILILLLPAFTEAQILLPIKDGGPGILTVGDFNKDGKDDVLTWGWIRNVCALGQAKSPYLRDAKTQPAIPIYFDNLMDAPVFHEDMLWVPYKTPFSTLVDIYSFDLVKESWKWKGGFNVTGTVNGQINTLRICDYHKDVDGDRKKDVMVVWGQTTHTGGILEVGIGGSYKGIQKTLKFSVKGKEAQVVDIMRCESAFEPGTSYQIWFSGGHKFPNEGFGTMILKDGNPPTITSRIWAQKGPNLRNHWQAAYGGIIYGKFGILPTGKVPMIHLNIGPSALFGLNATAPWVGNSGQWIETTPTSFAMPDATADYDGDGLDECVLALDVTGRNLYSGDLIIIGDPSANRPYRQTFRMSNKNNPYASAQFGATGDFDGDGDPDLLLSLTNTSQPGRYWDGHLAYFQCNRSKGKGKPALTRLY